MLPNSDIPHLPPIPALPPGGLVALWDPIAGITGNFDLSTLIPPSEDIRWTSTGSYDTGEIVTYGGSIWMSEEDANVGNVPSPASIHWTEVPKGRSGLTLWAAGVFTEDEIYVLYSVLDIVQLFRLNPAVSRPFNSTDFAAEWAANQWELISERGYLIQEKVAHGFAVNDVLKISGGWELFDGVGTPLGIVQTVIDADNFVILLSGTTAKGFVGLTAWATYYAQPDGSFDTVVQDSKMFVAISATQIIMLSGGGGGGVTPGAWIMSGAWNASTNNMPNNGDVTVKQGYTYENGNFSSTTMLGPDGNFILPYATARALVNNPGNDPSDQTKWRITY